MIDKTIFSIFQKGSRTYFYSSLFFPTKIRQDVFKLYAFVRKTDNYVDSIPQNKKGYYDFKQKYYKGLNGEPSKDIVIDSFIELMYKNDYRKEWIDAFFKSMEMDLNKKNYETLNETLEYIYGSAEVIGLMMAQNIGLTKKSHPYAKMLGRAMQYINFIRDIQEDIGLERIYLPSNDLQRYGFKNLTYQETKKHPEKFKNFIQKQIDRFCNWQHQAEIGYKFIPKKYLISIKTASEMYKWTATQIQKNPFVLYDLKVKPLMGNIIKTTIANMVDIQTNRYDPKLCYKIKTIAEKT
jgi:15-cis-phytoene synthase